MCQCRCLLRAFESACGPLGPEDIYPVKNMTFGRFTAGQHSQDHPVIVGRILDSSGLATIFAGFEPAGLRDLARYAGKGQATPHATLKALRASIAARWDLLAAKYIRKTCSSFSRGQEATVAKNGPFIELMDRQHPNTHQPLIFRADIILNKTLKKCNLVHK
jgi:hypothetical protein